MFRRMAMLAALTTALLGLWPGAAQAWPGGARAAGGVQAIAAGKLHTCAVTSTGAVKCWGAGGDGQLGNGARANAARPVQVAGLTSGVRVLASGGRHTCAVTAAGAVKCWGDNGYGQLGTGTTTSTTKPVQVAGLTSGVTALAAGTDFTCAVLGSGAVSCWGRNHRGQLGTGTTTDVRRPTPVVGLTRGVTAVAAGDAHTCAVVSGSVKCWGFNLNGQLGNGTAVAASRPVQVVGLTSGVAGVSAGYAGTCAVTTAGAVNCWGWATTVGSGTTRDAFTPVQVRGLTSGVRELGFGWFHACAVTGTGAARCWGYNTTYQLGVTGGASLTPTQVTGLSSGVVQITAGWGHSCARTTTGVVKCWGYNADGQLGAGSTGAQSATPVTVAGL